MGSSAASNRSLAPEQAVSPEAALLRLRSPSGALATGRKDAVLCTGKERDAESGLDYFGARYYGSSMGRWTSLDWAAKPEAVPYSSLDNPQSLNLYGYVLNNPLSKADPDGHSGCPPDCGDPTAPTATAPGASSSFVDRIVDAGKRLFDSPVIQGFLIAVPGLGAETGTAGELGATVEGPASSSTIGANAAQGKAFQDAVAAETAQTNTNVIQNVTLETQSGVRTVMDVVSKDASGNTALQEAKSSATAPLTRNQAAAHPEIGQTGATVVGKGKPGFPGGTNIPPTNVQVVRPKPPQQ